MTFSVDLPLPRDEMHQNARVDYRVKARAQAADQRDSKLLTLQQLTAAEPPRWERAEIHLHFRFRDRRARDLLNYAAAMKGQLDGVVKAGIIADDKCTVVRRVSGIDWSVDKANPGVTVTITPLAT